MRYLDVILENLITGIYDLRQCFAGAAVVYAVYLFLFKRRKIKGETSILKSVLTCATEFFFLLWIFLILKVTGLTEIHYFKIPSIQNVAGSLLQIPFLGHSFSMIFLNTLLFLPFGFFLSAAVPAWRTSFQKVFLTGFLFSVFIEVSQLFTGRMFEWDDLLANSSGTLFGFFLFDFFRNMFQRDTRKRGLGKMAVVLLAYGTAAVMIFYMAGAERVQNKEEEQYPGISGDLDACNDIMEMSLISEHGIFHENGIQDNGDFDTAFYWMADGIDSMMGSYQVKDAGILPELEDSKKMTSEYIEIVYGRPHTFFFYNKQDFQMRDVKYLLYDAESGTLWYGMEKKKIFGRLEYVNKKYPYQPDQELLGIIENGGLENE